MSQNTIYQKWVPSWLKLPLLIISLFPHLMLMSLFHSNTAFTASFLDIDTDDLQYLLILMYGTIVATLLILPRFMAYFSLKHYVLLMSSVSIILLYFLSVTTNYQTILILRFLEGIFGLLEGAIFLPLIIHQLTSKHAKIIAYLLLYCFMLTGGTFTSTLVKTSIENYSFQQMILMVLYFHIFVLVIAMVIFNKNRFFPKLPFYQMDVTGCFLLWVCLQSGAYAIIYGKRLMWFESNIIIFCLLLFLITGGLFILKQRTSKRPIFHFEVLTYSNIIIGLILFFIFYIIRSGLNNVYAIMANIWKWPWDYIIEIQYINVAGTILGFLFSGFFLIKNVPLRTIFFIGFLMLAIDCAWFTYIFYPDTTIEALFPPLFIQGIAQGFLFTPLVMFLLRDMPMHYSSNAAAIGTSVRFWTTAIGYALMQNLMLFLTTKHQNNLSANFIETNPIFNQEWSKIFSAKINTLTENDALRVTAGSFKAKMTEQAILLSNMEIYTWLFYLASFTAIAILLSKPITIAVKSILCKPKNVL